MCVFFHVFFKGSPRAPHARAVHFGGRINFINKGELWYFFTFSFPRGLRKSGWGGNVHLDGVFPCLFLRGSRRAPYARAVRTRGRITSINKGNYVLFSFFRSHWHPFFFRLCGSTSTKYYSLPLFLFSIRLLLITILQSKLFFFTIQNVNVSRRRSFVHSVFFLIYS